MISIEDLRANAHRAMNRLCKWRSVFAGWQLGTRSNQDPEAQAVRDMREALLLLRVDVTALIALLFNKKILSEAEFLDQVAKECAYYEKELEKRFPGFRATDTGMDIDVTQAKDTTKNWKP